MIMPTVKGDNIDEIEIVEIEIVLWDTRMRDLVVSFVGYSTKKEKLRS